MKEKKKLKFKKFHWHPITTFIVLTIFIILLSGLFSALQMQATYSTINPNTNKLESVLVTVENLLSYDGMKYIISNAARNFISFTPLSMLLISLIGLAIAETTGLVETFYHRVLSKFNKKTLTFFIIFIATISSLINEIGYVFMIPLAAMLFQSEKRNPLAGIVTAFCGVAFGYGVTLFVGSSEVGLIPYTTLGANLIDETFHVSLTSNLFIIIAFSIFLSLLGSFAIEKFIVPKMGKYKEKEETEPTQELEIVDVAVEEQEKLKQDKLEKRGLRYSLIVAVIIIGMFIYMIIPNLPGSGMLLDMSEKTYLGQLFGDNSYFQDGFTYMISLLFILMGIAYGIGAKTIRNDKDIIQGMEEKLKHIGGLVVLIFFASQFIAIFRKTNIGTILCAWGANLIKQLPFTGVPLILVVILLVALCNFVLTTPTSKWAIFSPVVVPLLMQSNISPQFAQMLLRAGDSITNGLTPLLAFFCIYVGYLNIYNTKKEKPITIRESISMVMPYFGIITASWILLLLGWYLIGLPIGPGVYPTL